MACDAWRDKLDAYLDGELAPADARELSVHTRSCAACAADASGAGATEAIRGRGRKAL